MAGAGTFKISAFVCLAVNVDEIVAGGCFAQSVQTILNSRSLARLVSRIKIEYTFMGSTDSSASF